MNQEISPIHSTSHPLNTHTHTHKTPFTLDYKESSVKGVKMDIDYLIKRQEYLWSKYNANVILDKMSNLKLKHKYNKTKGLPRCVYKANINKGRRLLRSTLKKLPKNQRKQLNKRGQIKQGSATPAQVTLPRSRKNAFCLNKLTGVRTRSPYSSGLQSGYYHVRIGSRRNDPINHVDTEPFTGSILANYDRTTNSWMVDGVDDIFYRYKFYSGRVDMNTGIHKMHKYVDENGIEYEESEQYTEKLIKDNLKTSYTDDAPFTQGELSEFSHINENQVYNTSIPGLVMFTHRKIVRLETTMQFKRPVEDPLTFLDENGTYTIPMAYMVPSVHQENDVTGYDDITHDFGWMYQGVFDYDKQDVNSPMAYASVLASFKHASFNLEYSENKLKLVEERTPKTLQSLLMYLKERGNKTFMEYVSDSKRWLHLVLAEDAHGNPCTNTKFKDYKKIEDDFALGYDMLAHPYYRNAQGPTKQFIPSFLTTATLFEMIYDEDYWYSCCNCNENVFVPQMVSKMRGMFKGSSLFITMHDYFNSLTCPCCNNRIFTTMPDSSALVTNTGLPLKGLTDPLHWMDEMYPGYVFGQSGNASAIVDEHDLRLLRRVLSMGKPMMIHLPCEATNIQEIQSRYKSVSIIPRPGLLHNHGGNATAELYALVGTAAQNLASEEFCTVSVPPMTTVPQNNNLESRTAITVFDSVKAKSGILALMDNGCSVIYCVTPSMTGTLARRQIGAYVAFTCNATDAPWVLPVGDCNAFDSTAIISTAKYTYINTMVRQGIYYNLVCLIKYAGDMGPIEVQSLRTNEIKEFSIPFLNPHGTGNMLGYGWIRKNVLVHKRLLSVLVRRNLRDGDLSFDSMMEAAIGLAMNRYNLADRTVKLINIDAETLSDHVVIACLMVRRMIMKQDKILTLMRADASWSNVGEQMLNSVAAITVGTMLQKFNALRKYANKLMQFHESAMLSDLDAVITDMKNWVKDAAMDEIGKHTFDFTPELKIPTCSHALGPEPENGAFMCTCCQRKSHTLTCSYCTVMPTSTTIPWNDDMVEEKAKSIGPNWREFVSSLHDPKDKMSHPSKPKQPGPFTKPKENTGDKTLQIPNTDNEHTFGAKNLAPTYHVHKCSSCSALYAHRLRKPDSPEYYKIGEKHHQYLGDCPWHEGCTTSIKILETTPGTFEAVPEMTNTGTSADDQMELAKLTSVEWARTLAEGAGTLWPGTLGLRPILKGEHDIRNHYKLSDAINYPFNDATCGRDALNHLYPHISKDQIAIVVGRHDRYTQSNIMEVAKACSLDILVISDEASVLARYGNGAQMKAMRITRVGGTTPHWEAYNFELVTTPNVPCSYLEDITENVLQVAHATLFKKKWTMAEHSDERIVTELRLLKSSLGGKAIVPRPIYKEGPTGGFLTNNTSSLHDLTKGLVHVQIPNDVSHLLPYVNSTSRVDLVSVNLGGSVDISDQIEGIHEERLSRIKDAIRSIVDGFTTTQAEVEPNDLLTVTTPFTVLSKEKIRLELPQKHVFKALDLIYLRSAGGFSPMIINPISAGGRQYTDIAASMPVSSVMTIKYRKALSVASAYRALTGLIKPPPPVEIIKNVLVRSNGILAPGGYGKTTEIVQRMNADTLVVCSTTMAQDVIKEGLRKALVINNQVVSEPRPELVENVISLERATYQDIPHKRHIIVDEAGMIRPYQLLTLINPESDYTFYGDDTQVGYIDFSTLGGLKASKSIFDYLPQDNISVKNTQYRVAEPLCLEIDKVRPAGYKYAGEMVETTDVDGSSRMESKRKTNFDLGYMHDWSDMAIGSMISSGRYDIVLVFHNDDVRAVEQAANKASTKVAVTTVHRSQGGSWRRGLVIQHRYSSKSGVEVSPRHCMTAATRFTDHLSWVSINCYENADLPTRMGKLGVASIGFGMMDKMKSWWSNIKDSDYIADCADELHAAAMKLDNWKPKVVAQETGFRQWAKYAAMKSKYESKYPVSVTVSKGIDYDIVTIKALGLTGEIHIYQDKVQLIRDMMGMIKQADIDNEMRADPELSQHKDPYSELTGLTPQDCHIKHLIHPNAKCELRIIHQATVAIQLAGGTPRIKLGNIEYMAATTAHTSPLNLCFISTAGATYWISDINEHHVVRINQSWREDDSMLDWLAGKQLVLNIDHDEMTLLMWFKQWWAHMYLDAKKIVNTIKPIFDTDGPFSASNNVYIHDVENALTNDITTDYSLSVTPSMCASFDMLGMPLSVYDVKTNSHKLATLTKEGGLLVINKASTSTMYMMAIINSAIRHMNMGWIRKTMRHLLWGGARPLQGKFMMDLAKHVSAGDRTGTALLNAFGRELVASVKYEPKTLVLHRAEDDDTNKFFRKEHNKEQVIYTTFTIPKEARFIMITRAVLHSLQTTEMNLNVVDVDSTHCVDMSIWHWTGVSQETMNGNVKLLSMLEPHKNNSLSNAANMQFTSGPKNPKEQELSEQMELTRKKALISINDINNERGLITNKPNRDCPVFISPQCLHHDIEVIAELVHYHGYLLTYLPIKSARVVKQGSLSNTAVADLQHGVTYNVPKWLIDLDHTKLAVTSMFELTVTVIGCANGQIIMRITRRQFADEFRLQIDDGLADNIVIVEVPSVSDNMLDDLLKGHVNIIKLKIREGLWRRIQMRMLRPDTKLNDLRVAIRHLLNNVEYMITHQRAVESGIDADDGASLALACYMIYHHKLRSHREYVMGLEQESEYYLQRSLDHAKKLGLGVLGTILKVLGADKEPSVVVKGLLEGSGISNSLEILGKLADSWDSLLAKDYSQPLPILLLGGKTIATMQMNKVGYPTEGLSSFVFRYIHLGPTLARRARGQYDLYKAPSTSIPRVTNEQYLALEMGASLVPSNSIIEKLEDMGWHKMKEYVKQANLPLAAKTYLSWIMEQQTLSEKDAIELMHKYTTSSETDKVLATISKLQDIVRLALASNVGTGSTWLPECQWLCKDFRPAAAGSEAAYKMNEALINKFNRVVEQCTLMDPSSMLLVATVGLQVSALLKQQPEQKRIWTDVQGMRVGIVTIGSTGDHLPTLSLCRALLAHGALPTVYCPRESAEIFTNQGILTIQGDWSLESNLKLWNNLTQNLNVELEKIPMTLGTNWLQGTVFEDTQDLWISTPIAPQGLMVAKHFGRPHIYFSPLPWALDVTEKENKYLAVLKETAILMMHGELISHWLVTHNSKINFSDLLKDTHPIMYCFDKRIISGTTRNYKPTFCGYLGWNNPWKKEPHHKGIVVTFGSMIMDHAIDLAQTAMMAAVSAGQRRVFYLKNEYLNKEIEAKAKKNGVTLEQWRGDYYERLTSEHVVIHHGGAGTTHAITYTGAKQLIVPVAFDQSLWAHLLSTTGRARAAFRKQDIESELALLISGPRPAPLNIDVETVNTWLNESLQSSLEHHFPHVTIDASVRTFTLAQERKTPLIKSINNRINIPMGTTDNTIKLPGYYFGRLNVETSVIFDPYSVSRPDKCGYDCISFITGSDQNDVVNILKEAGIKDDVYTSDYVAIGHMFQLNLVIIHEGAVHAHVHCPSWKYGYIKAERGHATVISPVPLTNLRLIDPNPVQIGEVGFANTAQHCNLGPTLQINAGHEHGHMHSTNKGFVTTVQALLTSGRSAKDKSLVSHSIVEVHAAVSVQSALKRIRSTNLNWPALARGNGETPAYLLPETTMTDKVGVFTVTNRKLPLGKVLIHERDNELHASVAWLADGALGKMTVLISTDKLPPYCVYNVRAVMMTNSTDYRWTEMDTAVYSLRHDIKLVNQVLKAEVAVSIPKQATVGTLYLMNFNNRDHHKEGGFRHELGDLAIADNNVVILPDNKSDVYYVQQMRSKAKVSPSLYMGKRVYSLPWFYTSTFKAQSVGIDPSKYHMLSIPYHDTHYQSVFLNTPCLPHEFKGKRTLTEWADMYVTDVVGEGYTIEEQAIGLLSLVNGKSIEEIFDTINEKLPHAGQITWANQKETLRPLSDDEIIDIMVKCKGRLIDNTNIVLRQGEEPYLAWERSIILEVIEEALEEAVRENDYDKLSWEWSGFDRVGATLTAMRQGVHITGKHGLRQITLGVGLPVYTTTMSKRDVIMAIYRRYRELATSPLYDIDKGPDDLLDQLSQLMLSTSEFEVTDKNLPIVWMEGEYINQRQIIENITEKGEHANLIMSRYLTFGTSVNDDVFFSIDATLGKNMTVYLDTSNLDEDDIENIMQARERMMDYVRHLIVSYMDNKTLEAVFMFNADDSFMIEHHGKFRGGCSPNVCRLIAEHMATATDFTETSKNYYWFKSPATNEEKIYEMPLTLVTKDVLNRSIYLEIEPRLRDPEDFDYELAVKIYSMEDDTQTDEYYLEYEDIHDLLKDEVTNLRPIPGTLVKMKVDSTEFIVGTLIEKLIEGDYKQAAGLLIAHHIAQPGHTPFEYKLDLKGIELFDGDLTHAGTFGSNEWEGWQSMTNKCGYRPEESNEWRNSDVSDMHNLDYERAMLRVPRKPLSLLHIKAMQLGTLILSEELGVIEDTLINDKPLLITAGVAGKHTLELENQQFINLVPSLPEANDEHNGLWFKPPTVWGRRRELALWRLIALTTDIQKVRVTNGRDFGNLPEPSPFMKYGVIATIPQGVAPVYLGDASFESFELSADFLLKHINAAGDLYGTDELMLMKVLMENRRMSSMVITPDKPTYSLKASWFTRPVYCMKEHGEDSTPLTRGYSSVRPGDIAQLHLPWPGSNSPSVEDHINICYWRKLVQHTPTIVLSDTLPPVMDAPLWFKKESFLGVRRFIVSGREDVTQDYWRQNTKSGAKLACIDTNQVLSCLDYVFTSNLDFIYHQQGTTLLPYLYAQQLTGLKGILEEKVGLMGQSIADDGEPADALPEAKDVRRMNRDRMLTFENESIKKMLSIGVPVGGWKTTLAREHPEIFADHDDYLDQEKHAALHKAGEWDKLSIFQKNAVIPKDRVLLTWGSTTSPDNRTYLGSVINRRSAREMGLPIEEYRLNLNEVNRIGLIAEGNYNMISTYDEFKRKCLGLVEDALMGDIPALRANMELADLAMMTFRDIEYDGSFGEFDSRDLYIPYIPPIIDETHDEGIKPELEDTPLDVINLYEDNDLTELVRVMAPGSEPFRKPVRSTEQALRIVQTMKHTLKKYPIRSRAVLTKMVYGELNATILRMENKEVIKKIDCNPEYEADLMAETFFNLNEIKYGTINYNTAATLEWIREHDGSAELEKELREILDEGFLEVPLNRVNVHQKLEALLKGFPTKAIGQMREQQVRIIVWQSKAMAAIFSPVFIEAKKRLKKILKQQVLYADGLRPDELNNYLRNIEDDNLFYVEDDGNKQDKRTEHQMLLTEMIVYKKYLKVADHIVDLWYQAHNAWSYKGSWVRGISDAMRQTGQATTAIGNVIVNLIVHTRLVRSLGNDFICMLVLGDDNLIINRSWVNAKEHEKDSALRWNMVQECETLPSHGTFLQMIVGPDGNGRLQASPDFIRLRNRFEVTNGVSSNPENTLEARILSYALMMGKTARGEKIIRNLGYETPLGNYFNHVAAINNCAARHGVNADLVRNEINDLYTMMENKQLMTQTWTHFTGVSRF
ncbi:polyprotein [Rhizoctonia solani endornavirus 1]|uniref:polyprotein n=1 Tax=Rhizoctonia solani endornavirus 1 TaxID=2162642 RepID=UPI000D3EF2BE|nr:polyprotein [Rhizoctonia solani endornavirus 1]AVZ46855.1 polyprotein [Rhizoctonia solani endornavirus 1]